MRVSPHVHALWLDFAIELDGGVRIPRFVPVFLVEGERLALVDTAVGPAVPEIFACVESLGRRPEEIACVVHTHGHFDHIGGSGLIAERARPRFYAHPLDRPIIEDLDLQEKLRPVGRMRSENVTGPVEVDELMNDGDALDLGGGVRIEALHTPGHSKGSLSLFVPGDGVLMCGDVLPEPGALPIYESVPQTLDSLERLREVEGAEVLLSSLSRRVARGGEVGGHIGEGEAYLRRIDALVRRAVEAHGGAATAEEAARFAFAELGLPEAGIIPIVVRTFEAHLEIEPLG